MNYLIDWLLEGPSWIQYRTRLDLMGQSENDPEVFAARKELLKDRDSDVRDAASSLLSKIS